MKSIRLLLLMVCSFAFLAIPASAQCGKLVLNPLTGQMDCVGLASSSATVSSVVIQGTANQVAVSGTCTITTSGTCTASLPANTIVPGVNGGTLQQAGSGLLSGTYTSGITATGTVGQTCVLTAFNNGNTGGTATVALTGANTIAGATALVITAAGSGNTSASTSATAGNGTATCSGTAVVATVLTGFGVTLASTGTTNLTLPSGTHTGAITDAAQTFTGTQTFSTPIACGSVTACAGPGASAYNHATQSLTGSSDNILLFDTNLWDTGSIHSTSVNTGRLTAPSTGYYLASCGVTVSSTASLSLSIRINNAVANSYANSESTLTVSQNGSAAVTQMVHLNTNDYIICDAFPLTTVTTTADFPFGQLTKIGTSF